MKHNITISHMTASCRVCLEASEHSAFNLNKMSIFHKMFPPRSEIYLKNNIFIRQLVQGFNNVGSKRLRSPAKNTVFTSFKHFIHYTFILLYIILIHYFSFKILIEYLKSLDPKGDNSKIMLFII